MDGAELTPTPTSPQMMMSAIHSHVARPTLGFPLGTALLLIIIFCLSGVFSCCYHWDKLRSLRRRNQQLPVTTTTTPTSPSKPTSQPQDLKKEKEMSLPVIMPGDRFPKFMALPCPCACPAVASTFASSADNGGMTVIAVSVLLISPAPSPSVSSSSTPQ